MGAWSLSDEEWDALDQLRFGTTDALASRNATFTLMTTMMNFWPGYLVEINASMSAT
jgi:hypothetical protein